MNLSSLPKLLFTVFAGVLICAAPMRGDDTATSKPPATLEQRVADLEAYITNSAPPSAAADNSHAPGPITAVPGPGHNGWIMVCAALVLFMTLPGLFLFYGGLVRSKNVLSVAGQCIGIAAMVTVLWWLFGYSLVFGKSFDSPLLGGTEFFFLKNVTSTPNADYSVWVSQNVFSMYQLMFAIITPALIVGAVAERIRFTSLMIFILVWMLVVYFPMAHMVWGATGLMNGLWNANASIKAIDFAGGTVVHMTSGWSALLLCILLGKRSGYGTRPMTPHSMVLCTVGTGMLWVGWYGFNAGSAVAADGIASNAFMTTTLATGVAAGVWGLLEYFLRKHASILGFCSGAVAGLVVITPAAGFVNATGAVIMGIFAAVLPFLAVTYLKRWLGYDDALDTFGVHAIGGTLGALLTGIFATAEVNGNLTKLLANGHLWIEQVKAIGLTLVLALTATTVIGLALKYTIGLRPTEEQELRGLDIIDHGEEGYSHS